MKKISIKFSKNNDSKTANQYFSGENKIKKSDFKKHEKITNGAKDFALRFESVMKELANG